MVRLPSCRGELAGGRRRRLFGVVGRLTGFALFCLTSSSALAAQESLDLSDGWALVRTQAGELPAPLAGISLDQAWIDLGLSPDESPFQIRQVVNLPAPLLSADSLTPADWAVGVGALAFGNYQLFADGQFIGQRGEPGGVSIRPAPEVFWIPSELLADGRVELRLSVDLWAWSGDVRRGGFPAVAGMTVGPEAQLRRLQIASIDRNRLRDLPELLFFVICLVIGLYHLTLFASRREELSYLWFGLGCLCFGVNAWVPSAWSQPLIPRMDLLFRITDASGHLAVFCFVPFLWELLHTRASRWVTGYQVSHLILAGAVLVFPVTFALASLRPRFVWMLVFLIFALGLLVREAWRGNPDARIMGIGGLLLVLAEIGEYLRMTGMSLPSELPFWGFTAVLVSMSAALAIRFSRTHVELDSLRVQLTDRVERRTRALAAVTAEAEQASQAKSLLLSTMSHELREPLKSVVAFASILHGTAEDVLDSRERDYARRIEANGRYALRLVSDLLDMSRLETGRLRLEPVQTDLGTLVREIVGDMKPSAEARSVTLKVELPDGEVFTWTDPIRLRQVLVNLIGNGIKFAPGGEVTTTVRTDGVGHSTIEVVDTGVGISGTLLSEITHGLSEAAVTPLPREGAGIGLQIARELCDLLGYELTFNSTRGNGTVARVTLPEPAAD